MIEEIKLCANDGKTDSMVEQYRGINVISKDVNPVSVFEACKLCVFNHTGCCAYIPCCAFERDDTREVYFIEVKDHEASN